eukprot:gb/GECH01014425.1/.p1 GENE.gb/GECH01014425.1/~~gb/GECH01014425.1/.p1  ORF type:complete len:949 (+),score=302.12 gb/GECH01014425.1/:1-2847(+)
MEWTGSKIRQRFIDFFIENKNHTFFASSPVVPNNDPTLQFCNAGMNQYKPIFLGQADPSSKMAKLSRAVNSQKCIRAGGKHNDLDDVGKDTYHHTFFEMLGNWSFGDPEFFKKEAIASCWELLTDVFGLSRHRLYATYFGGDEKLNLGPDLEARDFWLEYLPEDRVLPYGTEDNFWEMGDTGPCGPCSELHYDLIGDRDASHLVNADDPMVIEIWNLVFIQYNRQDEETLRPLPKKHIDTGMGLERITCILQNKHSNYDTDLFTPIFDAIQKETGARDYTGKFGPEDSDHIDTAYRVVADHIRTLVFAITDGAVPDAEGRGYVLRKIIRRAVRFGREILNAETGFLSNLVQPVVDLMGHAFPEITKNIQEIEKIIEEEEESFSRTLKRGIRLFNKVAQQTKESNSTMISGYDAFRLYSTYGFPLELTYIMADELGMSVDKHKFEQYMAKHKEGGGENKRKKAFVLEAEQTSTLEKMQVKPTDDSPKYNWEKTTGTVKAIFTEGRSFVDQATEETDTVGVILDRTNFYAEAGGQIYDLGQMTGPLSSFSVDDVQAYAGYVLHIGNVIEGTLSVGDEVSLDVDYDRRSTVAANHTTTHLLNFALRRVMGQGVDQKGSLVAPDRLRFDFSYNSQVKSEDMRQVEEIVRSQIKDELPVYWKYAPLDTAMKINGLRAMFGETYPDPVRVLSVGRTVDELLEAPEQADATRHSVEFCGGTHLQNTNQANDFVIMSIEPVAKGIKRIVAYTKQAAIDAHKSGEKFVQEAEKAKEQSGDALAAATQHIKREYENKKKAIPLVQRYQVENIISELVSKKKEEDKKLMAELKDKATAWAEELAKNGEQDYIVRICEEFQGEREALVTATDMVKKKLPETPCMVISGSPSKGRVFVMAVVPKSMSKQLNAGKWVKEALNKCSGKGGGKPFFAQGQGTDLSGINDAKTAAEEFAKQSLGK